MSNHNDRTNALVDLVRKIQEKSATDEEFRALALKDASAALAQMGVDKPPFSGEIQFIESNERTQIKVALPPAIGGEFSDSDLEAVAGGKSNNVNCHASDSGCVSASHYGNAGGSNINLSEGGVLHDDLGDLPLPKEGYYYDKNVLANLLSLACIVNEYWVRMDTRIGNAIYVQSKTGRRSIRFQRCHD